MAVKIPRILRFILQNIESLGYPFLERLQPTEHFDKKLKSIRFHNVAAFKRIMTVRDRLLIHPDDADGKMHGLYNGRFKKYVGRTGYRIIYYWCELCRKENRKRDDACEHCEQIPDRSVIFFDVYHKKDSKKYKRETSPVY